MALDVELTAGDVVRAHFWALSCAPIARLVVGLNALLLLVAALVSLRALARGEAPPLVLAISLLPLAVVYVAAPLAIRARACRIFEGLSESERRGTYTFDRRGFEWTLGRSPGRAPWTAVTATRETDARLFLLTPGARAHVLSTKAASPEALSRLKALLARRGESS